MPGYTADQTRVAGNMPDHDLTVRVVYLNDEAIILTIKYVFEDGSEAHETYYQEFFEANVHYAVASPFIPGYKPDISLVEGDMPDNNENVTVTVTYYVDTSDILLGDANGDGVVNANDALAVLRYTLNLAVVIDTDAADVNGDGLVNANDALMILRYALGLITAFPANNN